MNRTKALDLLQVLAVEAAELDARGDAVRAEQARRTAYSLPLIDSEIRDEIRHQAAKLAVAIREAM